MNISPEAAKALEMMPIKPRRQDWDPDAEEEEVKSIEFQYGRNSKDKIHYFTSIFSGKGGLSEAVPHARNTQLSLEQACIGKQVPVADRIKGFMAALNAQALKHAIATLTEVHQEFEEHDITLDVFIHQYVRRFGSDRDKEHQLFALDNTKKPKLCKVAQWRDIYYELNEYVEYCSGPGEKLKDHNYISKYFNSFPQSWQQAYLENNTHNIADATIDSITTYMKSREANAVRKEAENKIKQASNGSGHGNGNGNGDKKRKRSFDKNRNERDAPGGRANRAKSAKRVDKKQWQSRQKERGKGMCYSCPDSAPKHLYSNAPLTKTTLIMSSTKSS